MARKSQGSATGGVGDQKGLVPDLHKHEILARPGRSRRGSRAQENPPSVIMALISWTRGVFKALTRQLIIPALMTLNIHATLAWVDRSTTSTSISAPSRLAEREKGSKMLAVRRSVGTKTPLTEIAGRKANAVLLDIGQKGAMGKRSTMDKRGTARGGGCVAV